MPSKNPTTGRPLSGAAKRKRAALAQTAAYVARAKKAPAAPQAAQPAPAPASPASDFDRLPAAPLGQPAQAIAWVNDALLISLDQVLRNQHLAAPERWGWVERFGKALGMVRDKSAEQAEIRKALASQQSAAQARGTVSADGRSKKTISRPPG